MEAGWIAEHVLLRRQLDSEDGSIAGDVSSAFDRKGDWLVRAAQNNQVFLGRLSFLNLFLR